MPVPMVISDGRRIAEIDRTTNAIIMIDSSHHEIHDGTNFRAEVTANVGSGNTLSLSITTPAAPNQCHMTVLVHTGNSANIAIHEGVSLTANTGNAVTPRNSNRNYADNSSAVVKSQATINTTGSVQLYGGFTGPPGSTPADDDVGGMHGGRHEWILKPSTTYSVILTETGSAAQLMRIEFDWYEHTPKGDA